MNYTIVGAGTAGWLTALYVKKQYPDAEVNVIASSEIGILGAGEGTTPLFIEFLKDIDIPISGIIKHAKGTIKNSIKFTNWNGDGKHYYHIFRDALTKYENDVANKNFDFRPYYLEKISEGDCFNDIQLTPIISELNQVKFDKNTLESYGEYALHFDANLLAQYLQTVGLERGIKLVDDEVIKINTDSDGYISSLNLKSGNTSTTDFVFDCSGFKRLIIGNFYKSKWISYKNHLPVNRAMPFFVQNDSKDVPPYTESIAMKYGWMWKIPVQGRYGCGYVFDSSFATDDEIKKEIEDYVGHEINVPRVFSFEPGCYDEVCIKNCISIGLSSGFVEPLEATSIWIQVLMLNLWSKHKDVLNLRNKEAQNIFNSYTKCINKSVLNFIHLHYLSKRTDSKFWTTFSIKNKSLPLIDNFSELIKTIIPQQSDMDYLTEIETIEMGLQPITYKCIFGKDSWLQIAAGIKYFDMNVAEKILNTDYPNFINEKSDIKELFLHISQNLFDHNNYLENLKK